MLSYNGGITVKSPFRFENDFLNYPDFLNCHRNRLTNLTFTGKPSYKGLIFFYQEMGREIFGSLQAGVNILEDLIDVMDSLEEINSLSN